MVAVDLVLDSAAVGLGFWEFSEGGFYGVPPANYAGWVVSAVVATLLIAFAFDRVELLERIESCPCVARRHDEFRPAVGAINVFYGVWVPVAVAVLFGVALVAMDRFDFDVLPL